VPGLQQWLNKYLDVDYNVTHQTETNWLVTDHQCMELGVNAVLNSNPQHNYSTGDYYAKVHHVLPLGLVASLSHTVSIRYPLPTEDAELLSQVVDLFSHVAAIVANIFAVCPSETFSAVELLSSNTAYG
jgi:hypothetical protein